MSDPIEKLDAIQRAFDEFKAKNDTVIAEEIKKGTADVVRRDEVDRINADIARKLDEMRADIKAAEIAARRPVPGAPGGISPDAAEHKAAWQKWVRKGHDQGLAELEAKALNVTTSADGGYAVPEQLDRTILDMIKLVSPFRSVANAITIGGAEYRKLVNLHGTASGWVGETSSRPDTATPTMAEVTPFMGEIYANPAATQRMLDDAFFNVEAFLADEVALEFAKAEGAAFIAGNGTDKPKGFLAYTINASADGARTFGHLQQVKTGVAAGFKATTSSSNPGDTFIDVIHAMKSPLRSGAAWVMNTLTEAAVRKFRDLDGNYIWRPGLTEGQPSSILGYPVVEMADMPDIATTSNPIAFGNWRRAYTIVDRMGVRMLRDPYTNKPYVQFYTTKRVGGMVVDSEAIKILSCAT